MIAFTILGLLVFWIWCFQIGYHLIPAINISRSAMAVWLIGRKADRLIAVLAAVSAKRHQVAEAEMREVGRG